MSTHVYRVYDEDGALLYIGCTYLLRHRLDIHRHQSLWRSRIARWAATPYPTRAEALAAERSAIQTEFPRWNVLDRSPLHPDGELTLVQIAKRYPGDVTRPTGGYPASEFDRRFLPVLADLP